MIDRDPVLEIRDLLYNQWDASNTSLDSRPSIQTGWFDFGAGDPQVSITNQNEFTLGGGATGQTSTTGAQARAGTVYVNGWSGTRDELAGAASDGSDINPKQMSFELAHEIDRIIDANASGTTDSSGNTRLNTLGADGLQAIPETDGPEFVHRREFTVKYTYVDTP